MLWRERQGKKLTFKFPFSRLLITWWAYNVFESHCHNVLLYMHIYSSYADSCIVVHIVKSQVE